MYVCFKKGYRFLLKKILAEPPLGELMVREENFVRTSPCETDGHWSGRKFWQNLPLGKLIVTMENFGSTSPGKPMFGRGNFGRTSP